MTALQKKKKKHYLKWGNNILKPPPFACRLFYPLRDINY